MLKSIFAMLMFCLVVGSVVAQDNEVNGKGRYQLQVVDTRYKPLKLFLLDTETGKVWTMSSDDARWKQLPYHAPFPPFPEMVTTD